MKKKKEPDKWKKATAGGFLIALGVVYGDIGTSPLYVMKSIVQGQGGAAQMNENFLLGVVSLIFWTITIITTLKYVVIALNADNHKEGGIFSLFSLVRRMRKWLIVPAIIGGATLLSDGALTPAVTVTSAVEGLRGVPAFKEAFGTNQTVIIVITLAILAILFFIQRFGTNLIGKLFGPIMMVWFLFIGGFGLANMLGNIGILRALNPYYAINLLFSPMNKNGIFILGSVFLATTGAEALYSDLGHVGKHNIHVSWPVVKVCLILSYCGQASWLLKQGGSYGTTETFNPFYDMLPHQITIYAVILAALAAIIASQALISGSYTLVSEAIRLRLFPLLRIMYPGKTYSQMYIPAVNFVLWLTCSGIVLYFRDSAHMEAAYGLAITLTMLMTTILLTFYLKSTGLNPIIAHAITFFFGAIEIVFFLSSVVKFIHGGYVVVIIALFIMYIMFIWMKGSQIVTKYIKRLDIKDYIPQLRKLRDDTEIDMYQTNIVYLTNRVKGSEIDMSILYSILDKKPKRAEVYWFVTVVVTDMPYTQEYEVDMLGTDFIVKVTLYLGFHMPQAVPRYLRSIIVDMMEDGRLPKQRQKYTINPGRVVGDFGFILIDERLSNGRNMTGFERFVMLTKLSIKKMTTTPARWFGLQFSDYTVERVPLILGGMDELRAVEREPE